MEKYYWLTTPNQGDIKNLEMDPLKREVREEDLQKNCLWFKDNELDEANQFLLELKTFLRDQYCTKFNHSDRALWMDAAWEQKGLKKTE